MNITSADPTAPPPPQPPQPTRSSFSCDRHPNEQFTGFCPSCLCERLTTLDSSSITPSSSLRHSSASAAAAAALKSLFSTNSRANNFPPPPPPPPKPSKPTSFLPELRRTKSFSASKNEGLGLTFEPHRKSCDVRVQNTLWSLFSLDDESKNTANNKNKPSFASSSSHQNHHNSSSGKPIEYCLVNEPVLEEVENDEDFKDPPENLEDIVDDDGDRDEIRSVEDNPLESLRKAGEINVNSSQVVVENVVSVNNLKPMKDHMDLVTQGQLKRSSGGGFWAAASVFSKKWHKWRRKQKVKKQNNGKSLATLPVEKPISRQYGETQSEIGDYGFGRRSCDIDPRFSLDAPRISFDGPRYSLDEPRASWDGYLIGRNFPRMAPMVSLLEDAPHPVRVSRADMRIPLEEPSFINENENAPGGSAQTRDYYLDSSSRRRKSLDRSNSIRKTAAAVVAEIDELKMASSNDKVLLTNADYFHGANVVVGERDTRDSYPNSLRGDDVSETFELSSGFRESITGIGEKKETKKGKKWGWKIWGFMHRRNNKDEDEEEKYSKYSSVNGVERSLSQSWEELRREGNGESRGSGEFNRNVLRSNSSVSWRNENPFGGVRRSSVEVYGNGKRRSDFVLDNKSRNVRYSPNNLDNGLLRFYLAPMRTNRRGGTGKVKPTNTHSVARSVLGMY